MKKRHKSNPARSASASSRGLLVFIVIAIAGVGAGMWALLAPKAPPSPAPVPASSSATKTNTALQSELTDAQQEKALHNEAVDSVSTLLAAFPDNDDAVYLAGLVHQDLGDTARAIELWERSLVIDPTRADAWDSLGSALLNKDDYEGAETHFRKALELDPSFADARLHLATTLSHQGKMEEVVSILEDLPALNAKACQLLGGAYQQLRRYEEAKTAFERAIELDPELIDAYYALSQTCARLGDREKRAAYWKTFSEMKARSDDQAREQRDVYSPLIATRKNIAKAHTNMGRVYMANRRFKEAEALWLRARDLDPHNTVCRLQLAILAQQARNLPQALAFFEEVAVITPDDPILHLNLGQLNVRMNRLKQAGESFVKVIRLQPEQPPGYVALIELFLQTRTDLERARKLAEHCVTLAPTAPHYALLSRTCAANNDRDAALVAIDRSLELEPGNSTFLKLREQLQQNP